MPEPFEMKNVVNNPNRNEEEFELLNLLMILWRWKYLIIAGTVFCAVASAVISHNLTQIYRVSTVLETSIAKIAQNGQAIYTIHPLSIKSLIEKNVFNNQIKQKLEIKNDPKIYSADLNFKVFHARNTNSLIISHDTPNIDLGIKTLECLTEVIREQYIRSVDAVEDEYQNEIDILRREILVVDVEKGQVESNIIYIGGRLKELSDQIRSIKENMKPLETHSGNVSPQIRHRKGGTSSSLLSYSKDDLKLINAYKSQFDNFQKNLENEKINIVKLNEDRNIKKLKIGLLEKKIRNLKVIEVIKPPTATKSPIKPKTKLNVVLGTLSGFIFFLLVSLTVEFLLTHKKSS
jgi:LPS O-antigen subunit length determinant protein (WzzB/FepE family)